jgi:anti-sigma factor RsiW
MVIRHNKKRREMEKRILKLLYRSLDTDLKEKDRRRLNKALAESEELRQYKMDIISLRQAVAQIAAPSFALRFGDRVMSRIRSASGTPQRHKALVESYRWVFRRLTAVAIVILIVLVLVAVVQDGLFPKDAIFYISDTAIDRILQVPVF